MLDNLQRITIEKPADKIIKQIKMLISSGELSPGDKLPPERTLADHMGVGRSAVRDAIRKLEFYGILKTLPQSGTVVAGIGITALEGLISDVLEIEEADFTSLVETRVLLEAKSAFFAAERRTEEDLSNLNKALDAYEMKVSQGVQAVEEDLLFHLKIAEAGKNKVLRSLMLIITPDIVTHYVNLEICGDGRPHQALKEHKEILKHIENREAKLADLAMRQHLDDVLRYSLDLRSKNNGSAP